MSSSRRTVQVIRGVFGLILFHFGLVHAATLVWDPNLEPDVAGYNVRYTNITAGNFGVWDAGDVTEVPINVAQGHTYQFTVTAYTGEGVESDPSAPVTYTAPDEALRITWEASVSPSIAGYTLWYGELNQTASGFDAALQTSAQLANLRRGTSCYFYVTGRDASGNNLDTWTQVTAVIPTEGPFPTIHILRQNLPPQVKLTSPVAASTFGAPATITLTAEASDADGSIASVDFYAGVTRLFSRTTPPFSGIWSNVPAGTFQVSVAAMDSRGAITRSAPVSISVVNPIPAAPANLIASSGENFIRLNWIDLSDNETGFRVYRWNGSTYALLATLAANSVQHLDTNLPPATTFTYRLTAFNATGESAALQLAASTAQAKPPAPATVTATADAGAIALSWTLVSGADQYHVQRATNSAGPFGNIAAVPSNTFRDANVVPGIAYFYRVLSESGDVFSEPSAATTAMVPMAVPIAPSSLKASVGKAYVALSWRDNSSNETSFVIERSLNGSSFSPIATLGANSMSYMDRGIAARTRYYYRVVAKNSGGGSASPYITVKTR